MAKPNLELHLKVPQARAQVHEIILNATRDVFQLDIQPQAVENSPVTPAGLLRNEALGRKNPGGTGTNRRSIDTEIAEGERGPEAKLFTQSGYGGYLEVGTSRMSAQPYLYPAFEEHVSKIGTEVQEQIKKATKTK
jgi:HK97 gp10 family phage protein